MLAKSPPRFQCRIDPLSFTILGGDKLIMIGGWVENNN